MDAVVRGLIKSAAPVWKLWSRAYDQKCPKLLSKLIAVSGARIRREATLVTGQKMSVNPFDKVGGAIYRDGCFERETVDYVRAYLKPGMTFIDIGANIGQYTLIASDLVGGCGRVHAFEPHPEVFRDLRENVQANSFVCPQDSELSTNIELHQLALSEKEGNAQLFFGHSNNAGANSLRPTVNTSSKTVEISMKRMDDVLGHLEKIDMIKMDIEGAELLALRGGEGVIKRTKPVIVMELTNDKFTGGFGYTTDDIVAWLNDHGYRIEGLRTNGLVPFNGRVHNVENIVCFPTG